MQFIDECKIHIQSGKGGNGCHSFRREKFVSHGGPDGGDGGRGGSIIIRCNPHINTLVDYRFKQSFKAANGQDGMGSNRTGKSGEDLYILVPLGTQIFDETSNLLIFDFNNKDDEFTILKGGKGGLGNTHFKSSINQAPDRTTKGEPAEEMWIQMKLKLLSDVGLVGLPNAGKSTFLSRVTSAKPKIADYPFTTLKPGLGVVYVGEEEFVLADIPGLIEGAHEGHGLGDRFLKHIERCRLLIHLIDITSDDIIRDYNIIRSELESYSDKLLNKTEIICLSKSDLLNKEDYIRKKKEISEFTTKESFVISAGSMDGVQEVLKKALTLIKQEL
jgi:GTPase